MNPVRARQLLTNLVENAVRHGGRDDIRVRSGAEPGPSGYAVVTVSDDGVGIPEEHRERIFGIFERLGTTGASGGGTGIGLAICHRIVESFGGGIRAREADEGAIIEVTLPQAEPPAQTARHGRDGVTEPAIRRASDVTRSTT
jgi:signal transduction histidine kinase